MRFLRCGPRGKEKPAVLDKNNKIRDLSSYISDLNPENINFKILDKLKEIDLTKLPEIPKSTRIGSCINKPGKFIGIGLNYSDHAIEYGAKIPTEPIIFMKATSCICGPNDNIIIPKNSKKLDWEVEIAFVIGKKAKYIKESESSNYIFGYCLVNDVTEREWQLEKLGQWVKGKSGDTFGPIGPYLVTKEEIANVQNLKMNLEINGKNIQNGNTSKMIFNINYVLSYLSNFMSLEPGDIITTGTPFGVGMGMKPPTYLKPDDEIKLSVDNLGEQFHKVKREV
tara:strand:- start:1641 stop:2486 length:846 start_codon:yes stop_codon:yes gene_type:complete